jgi:hypothetical protein
LCRYETHIGIGIGLDSTSDEARYDDAANASDEATNDAVEMAHEGTLRECGD